MFPEGAAAPDGNIAPEMPNMSECWNRQTGKLEVLVFSERMGSSPVSDTTLPWSADPLMTTGGDRLVNRLG